MQELNDFLCTPVKPFDRVHFTSEHREDCFNALGLIDQKKPFPEDGLDEDLVVCEITPTFRPSFRGAPQTFKNSIGETWVVGDILNNCFGHVKAIIMHDMIVAARSSFEMRKSVNAISIDVIHPTISKISFENEVNGDIYSVTIDYRNGESLTHSGILRQKMMDAIHSLTKGRTAPGVIVKLLD